MTQHPYPGLRAFERSEADIFFGRDAQLDKLLGQLSNNHFLAVIAPSGYGKSSLVRTGLLANLEMGFLPQAGGSWRFALCQPGHQPFANFTQALLAEDAIGKEFIHYLGHHTDANQQVATIDSHPALLQARLQQGPLSLVKLFDDIQKITEFEEDTSLLLVIDQFEEIFRHAEQGAVDETTAFVELLLATSEHKRIFVVITMRADYIGDCAQFYGLTEAVSNGLFLVPRLTRDQLEEAITAPAEMLEGDVQSALVTRLLNEAGDNPHQLPVLQHALMRMWDLADKQRVLTLQHYQDIGGLENALSSHADEAFNALNKEQQEIAAILFKSLTERDTNTDNERRDTRRPVFLREIVQLVDARGQNLNHIPADDELKSTAKVIVVINEFRREGRHFLTPSLNIDLMLDTKIDISHESLIWLWQKLRHWVNEETKHAEEYQRLEEAALRWQAQEGALWRTPDLEIALRWRETSQPSRAWARRYGQEQGKYFDLVMQFLDKSKAAQLLELQKQKRRFHILVGLLLATILATVLITLVTVLAIWQWREAEQATQLAQKKENEAVNAESNLLAGLAQQQSNRGLTFTAAQLALEALPSAKRPNRPVTIAAQQALFDSFQQPWILEHPTDVYSAVFNPAGTQVLTAAGDDAWIWNVQSGELVEVLKGHKALVYYATYNPAGTQIVTVSKDKTARLWDARNFKTGHLQHVLEGHQDTVRYAAYSPTGKQLATASYDYLARLWDTQTGKLLHTLKGHNDILLYVAYSPTGEQLATASATVKLWDSQTPKKTITLEKHQFNILQVIYNPTRPQLATSAGRKAYLWDTHTHRLQHELGEHQDIVRYMAYSPTGKQLATASHDGIARLWDTHTGQLIAELKGHKDELTHIAYNPTDTQLATTAEDKTARLWDMRKLTEQPKVLEGHQDTVWFAEYNADGTRLVTASTDNTARLWNTQSGKPFPVLYDNDNIITDITIEDATYNALGTRLATTTWDNTAHLWDTQTGQLLSTLPTHEARVWRVVVSPAATQLATVADDNIVRLWDTQTNALLAELKGHTETIVQATYNLAGTQLVTASFDNTARIWDIQAGEVLHVLLHPVSVSYATYNPTGTQIATTSSEDSIVRLWNPDTGELLAELQGHEDEVSFAAYNPTSTHLATATYYGQILLWNIQTQQPVTELYATDELIQYLAYNAAGTQLVSVSRDKVTRLWEVQAGQLFATLPAQSFPKFSADGQQLTTLSTDNEIRHWRLFANLDHMIKAAQQRTRHHPLTCQQRKAFFLLEQDAPCE